MEETYSAQAIILKRGKFREHDSRVIVYLPEKGKIELVARGTNKLTSKINSHIEPISLVNILVIKGKTYDYLGSSIIDNCYLNIKNDLDKIIIASKAARLLSSTVKDGNVQEKIILYNLLKDFWEFIDKKEEILNLKIIYSYYVFKLISISGYQPILDSCIICKTKITPGKNKFDLSGGGLICSKCKSEDNSYDISDNAIKVLRMINKNTFEELNKIKISKNLYGELEKIILLFYKYNLN